jgi:type IV secretory pathway VirB2 component (pilin)
MTLRRSVVPTASAHNSRRTLTAASLLAVALGLAFALLLSADAHAALQQLAGYEKSNDNRFASLYSYLANLRDAILPLSIPVGTIGLVVVGGMYMFGSPSAGRILFGVAIGIGMVLLAPSIIA